MNRKMSLLALSALGGLAWAYSKRARTYMQLHPELRSPYLRVRSPGLISALLPAFQRRANRPLPALDGVQLEKRQIPGPPGAPPVTVYLYTPAQRAPERPALLYIHGGGYVGGSAVDTHDLCAGYARELGGVVISVEYRLAPQTPFPGPLEDCYAALTWLNTQAHALDLDPQRIALAGHSAGGGLAAALAQVAHDRAEVNVAFQLLYYPMLDDRTTLHTGWAGRGEYIWTPQSNLLGWTGYLGRAPRLADAPPYAVPARREDLRGLPPAWIGVGTLDLFYEEDREYARRLNAAGVPCDSLEVPGAYHAFEMFSARQAVSQAFNAAALQALRRGLGLAQA